MNRLHSSLRSLVAWALAGCAPAAHASWTWYNSFPDQVLVATTARVNPGLRSDLGYDLTNVTVNFAFPAPLVVTAPESTNGVVRYSHASLPNFAARQYFIDVFAPSAGVFQVTGSLTGQDPTGGVFTAVTGFPLRVTRSLLSGDTSLGPDQNYAYFSVYNGGVGPASNVSVLAYLEHGGYEETGLALVSTYISRGSIVETNFQAYSPFGAKSGSLLVRAALPSLAPGEWVEGAIQLRLDRQQDTTANLALYLNAEENGSPLFAEPRFARVSGARLLSWHTYGQPTDYDLDGWPDVASLIRDQQNLAAYLLAGGSNATASVGAATDPIPVPDDYNGDLRVDAAVYDAADSGWLIPASPGTPASKRVWGPKRALPVPADYNGDRRADLALFVPATGRWVVEVNGQTINLNWGSRNAVPVPGDFDRDARADVTVYFPNTGEWFTQFASGQRTRLSFGGPGMAPYTGDFDGNGTLDRAVFHRSSGTWYVRLSDGTIFARQWGYPEGWPMVQDVNADGTADLCVCDPPTGRWFILTGRTGQFLERSSRAGALPANLQFQINRRMRLLP